MFPFGKGLLIYIKTEVSNHHKEEPEKCQPMLELLSHSAAFTDFFYPIEICRIKIHQFNIIYRFSVSEESIFGIKYLRCGFSLLLLVPLSSILDASARLLNSIPAQVQLLAPSFTGTAVVDSKFADISLKDFVSKYVCLLFYPLDFTFVCPTELIAFSDRNSEFQALNTQLIGISTDSHYSHLAWIKTSRENGGLGSLSYPLLADLNKEISLNYGVLIPKAGIALRGMFIIDPDGIIRHMSINDLPVGRSVDEALRLIKAFQFVAKHGEVCPANWKPGSPTIKPTPEGSKEYFNKNN